MKNTRLRTVIVFFVVVLIIVSFGLYRTGATVVQPLSTAGPISASINPSMAAGSAVTNTLPAVPTVMTVQGTALPMPTTAASGTPAIGFPIRAAFYYPWFPEAWNQQGFNPFTHFHPLLGFYDSSSISVVHQHIREMLYGGITAGISSWWGPGTPTDGRVKELLAAATGSGFRWALYYEKEGIGNPSPTEISSDLTYIRDHYTSDPSYLKIDGRFVVFVYGEPTDDCGMADRWKQGNTVNAYIVLKVFPKYMNCPNQPDGWHQYSPADAVVNRSLSYTISPGFWKEGEETARLARDLNQWNNDILSMLSSGARFQLITTFNEWGEGTAIEPAKEWSSPSGYGAYLDALHNNGDPPAAGQPIQAVMPTP
ncbi:MAG: hypothetical protein P4L50_18470 [Anaerolineaceae bacterium]|nr:hypothetical protein [Anaerolineaceae bacterium]